jgi:tetrahydromethanopterin S-methyltransferase subunit G|tara:strand:- start:2925 stop:3158 length:234 start_codon:yes stop_codon:yes gene_type:complete
MSKATDLERENLEAHVDLCQQRYENLESRLTKIEEKVDSIHKDVVEGQKSMTKVLIGAAGTIVAGLLSTIIVLVMNL